MFTNIPLYSSLYNLSRSATLEINELSDHLHSQGKKVYKLGLGQSPFPVPDSVVEELRKYAYKKDYLPVQGLRELREAVSDYHKNVDHVNLSPEGVQIGPGSKELMFLLQLAFDGEIIFPTPCWVSYAPQARILGRRVNMIHSTFQDRWRLLPQQLDAHCSSYRAPRLLFLNYPGNPDGLTYTKEELKNIADIARKYKIIIISDEIYGLLTHKTNHPSIAKYYPEGTIISAGLSKWCGAGGWRLGTFIFPKELYWLLKATSAIASETYTSVSAPIQYAAITGFKLGDDIIDYLFKCRSILSKLGQTCAKILQDVDVRLHDPLGGFYLFPDFENLRKKLTQRGITNSTILCKRLLDETGVAILPGAVFGRDPKELTARIAYVNFDGANALSQYSNYISPDNILSDSFLDDICSDTIKAIKLFADWLCRDS